MSLARGRALLLASDLAACGTRPGVAAEAPEAPCDGNVSCHADRVAPPPIERHTSLTLWTVGPRALSAIGTFRHFRLAVEVFFSIEKTASSTARCPLRITPSGGFVQRCAMPPPARGQPATYRFMEVKSHIDPYCKSVRRTGQSQP